MCINVSALQVCTYHSVESIICLLLRHASNQRSTNSTRLTQEQQNWKSMMSKRLNQVAKIEPRQQDKIIVF